MFLLNLVKLFLESRDCSSTVEKRIEHRMESKSIVFHTFFVTRTCSNVEELHVSGIGVARTLSLQTRLPHLLMDVPEPIRSVTHVLFLFASHRSSARRC